ncbi:DUF374 domain-containing protein [Spongiibacter sp. KMU-158]|uniref:DUF374 domain-containing protein n=1 Tax=Spongiibacter pelagi TaxID=2760804 RepID=A0A927C3H0_9GAMM|nr:DUF374 domain-containing protein [Spongiibacter pelagi]MBD2859122.1 DUF374 domain-containing protein [Spongiibacter pelagi]
MAKKIKKIGPAQKVARQLLSGILRLMFASMRTLRYRDIPELQHPCVMAIFHDELLPLVYYYQPGKADNFASIASQNHFGWAIANVMERYGYEVALGSPSKGGKDAFFQLLRAARAGKDIAFTVDGSRGPRHEMKPGALLLARKTGLPIYLLRAEYKGWRIESTWDKFKIPLPFSTVRFKAELFPLNDPEAEMDTLVADAEQRLNALIPDDYKAKQ